MAGVALPDGLVLRTAGPADLDQIGQLLADRGDPVDRLDHRLAVEDPDLGWPACAVVLDGDRVVSTALLLDESLRVADVVLPAGQVELVATHSDYEGRGLVRALMGWAHERSAARGHLLQVMIGIPYFYRLFGYEYAIDMPPARQLVDVPAVVDSPFALRRARPDDIPALAALQDTAQRRADVAMPHPPARWRWLLEHEASSTWLLERDGLPVASARTRAPDDGVLVAEATAVDERGADELLLALVRECGPDLTIVDRPGTTSSAWSARLAPADGEARQYYVRLPAPEQLLDALRPLLHRRLTDAGRGPGRQGRRHLDVRSALPDGRHRGRLGPGAGRGTDAGAGIGRWCGCRARLPGSAAARAARHGRPGAAAPRRLPRTGQRSCSTRCSRR